MLELVPVFGMSTRYSVRSDGREVAEVALGWFREGGELVIDGVRYQLRREGLASGAFQLSRDGGLVVEAHKPSAFSNRFDIEHDGHRYELAKAGFLTKRFELRQDGRAVGSIAPHHPFTRRCEVALPDALPLPVQVFLTALVVLMWNRDANTAAGTSGST